MNTKIVVNKKYEIELDDDKGDYLCDVLNNLFHRHKNNPKQQKLFSQLLGFFGDSEIGQPLYKVKFDHKQIKIVLTALLEYSLKLNSETYFSLVEPEEINLHYLRNMLSALSYLIFIFTFDQYNLTFQETIISED